MEDGQTGDPEARDHRWEAVTSQELLGKGPELRQRLQDRRGDASARCPRAEPCVGRARAEGTSQFLVWVMGQPLVLLIETGSRV